MTDLFTIWFIVIVWIVAFISLILFWAFGVREQIKVTTQEKKHYVEAKR
jgi:Na+/melibiose symporter-like transporter